MDFGHLTSAPIVVGLGCMLPCGLPWLICSMTWFIGFNRLSNPDGCVTDVIELLGESWGGLPVNIALRRVFKSSLGEVGITAEDAAPRICADTLTLPKALLSTAPLAVFAESRSGQTAFSSGAVVGGLGCCSVSLGPGLGLPCPVLWPFSNSSILARNDWIRALPRG